jgi:hypothetical protein
MPTGKHATVADNPRQPSIASVVSDLSGYATPQGHFYTSEDDERSQTQTPKPQRKQPYLRLRCFSYDRVYSIEASQPKSPLSPLTLAEDFPFGWPIDMHSLHPSIRDIYADAFQKLEEVYAICPPYSRSHR